MSGFMISEIEFYLLQKGAHNEPRRITTNDIAAETGISQQTASRKLIELEKAGRIERIGGKLFLAPKAVEGIRKFVRGVLESLESGGIVFSGKVTAGLGEGAFFLRQKQYADSFKKKLGFAPFAGTLNIRLNEDGIEKRIMLREEEPIAIPGFRKGSRTFGKIDAYRCVIAGIPCAIVFPERSIHGLQVLEIVSSFNLRKKLGLKDGSQLEMEVV